MATLAPYTSGTCSVSEDGTVVTFSSALMQQHAMSGDSLSIDRNPSIKVRTVIDQLHLGIDPYPYATVSNVEFALEQDSILRTSRGQPAVDMAKINAALNRSGYYYSVGPDEAEPDPSDGDENQYAQQESTGKRWQKRGGVWVYLGLYALFVARGVWDDETDYDVGNVVQRGGKLWRSRLGDNLNHVPELSPTYWEVFLAGGDAYDIPFWDSGRSGSAELVLKEVFAKTVTFYSGLSDSKAAADVASTGTVYYSLNRNGVQFAYIQFAVGNPIGIFATGATDTTFVPGDILTIYAPETRDETLKGVAVMLSGYRD